MTDSRRLVDKLWSYCDVLRDDGVGVIEYTEQLTYLLFLKMAHERATRKLRPQQIVPEEYSWQKLLDAQGDQLEFEYTRILTGLARQPGVIGTIFRKAQNRIQDPAKLKRLVVDLIDKENWSGTGTDIKGDAYEELLSKGASDKGSGAGQYFTPRALIQAIVDVIQPTVDDSVVDPACGTGGFLLVASECAVPEWKASMVRVRAFCERLPCSSTAGMPEALSWRASFLARCLVRVKTTLRPGAATRSTSTGRCASGVTCRTWWLIVATGDWAESASCVTGEVR